MSKNIKFYINYVLLFFGILSIVIGSIFFFAYNWNVLNKWHKFIIANLFLIITSLFAMKGDIKNIKNRLLFLGLSILIGGYIALIGQVYHSGADTYQLFLIWGLLILPIVLSLNFAPLWLLGIILLNLTLIFYYRTFFGFGFVELNFYTGFTILIIINSTIMAIFALKSKDIIIPRFINLFNNGVVTVLVLSSIFQEEYHFTIALYLLWISGNFYLFRIREVRTFQLSMCLMSILATSIGVYIKLAFESLDEMTNFFVLAVIAISISSLGVKWLRSIGGSNENS